MEAWTDGRKAVLWADQTASRSAAWMVIQWDELMVVWTVETKESTMGLRRVDRWVEMMGTATASASGSEWGLCSVGLMAERMVMNMAQKKGEMKVASLVSEKVGSRVERRERPSLVQTKVRLSVPRRVIQWV